MALPNQFDKFESRPSACFVCEAMLPDAVDGSLSDTEQRAFDIHVAGCIECSNELAEARRGAAWLGMLKTQAPEPPARLLEKIIAQTSGAAALAAPPALAYQPVWAPAPPQPRPTWSARWVTARRQVSDVFSIESARATFQPRMAMTAAMAFFSIALTLNLTGIRLTSLRASTFTPSGIKRTVADASASATRMFQNNRAVYQVESRLSEARNDDAPGGQAPVAHR